MDNYSPRIVLLGSGNVATSLGQAWERNGAAIVGFCNRKGEIPAGFSTQDVPCFNHPSSIDVEADFALVAVRDEYVFSSIEALPSQLTPVHFSGAQSNPQNGGVIWPAQSIQLNDPEAIKKVPLVVTASDGVQLERITSLAQLISPIIHPTDAEKRMKGHLAAVFAVNFTNHAFAIAQRLAADADLDWDWFVPMIEATCIGAVDQKSEARQTGPGIRREEAVLSAQIQALQAHSPWREFYEAATHSIQNMHKTQNHE
ncbi:MAG: DUF2520 domain-containing protein [Flavobacteriales bacterium]